MILTLVVMLAKLIYQQIRNYHLETRKRCSESADPAKALGPSNILDRKPVVDTHYLLFSIQQ